ncbi:Mitochondrial import inner membrane translocase subunit TIM13 [Bienertia sinuspersici]
MNGYGSSSSSSSGSSSSQPNPEVLMDQLKNQLAQAYAEEFLEKWRETGKCKERRWRRGYIKEKGKAFDAKNTVLC